MLALRDLQTAFRLALLAEDKGALHALGYAIDGEGLAVGDRLAVYRNNVFVSLSDALKQTFPAVCRLVDERFFSYAAHEFIARHPPSKPALAEYGAEFPEFLASFPACSELAYLPDVARFEWLMNASAHAQDANSVSAESLSNVAPEDAAELILKLHPSYFYLSSPFPIDAIWRANRSCDAHDADIDLASGGVRVEVSRHGADVVFCALDEATFAFRCALAEGACLSSALERALAAEPQFLSAAALAALFEEGAITAVTLPRSMEPAR